MSAPITLSSIVASFGGKLLGPDQTIQGIASLTAARRGELSFLTDRRYLSLVSTTQASALIVSTTLAEQIAEDKSLIVTEDPYLYYARVARFFHPAPVSNGISHPSAVVSPGASIGEQVEIGAGVVIEDGVVIGSGSRVLAGGILSRNVQVGKNCVIHPNVTVLSEVQIGNQVEIHSGTVIGADGFGLAWNGENWEKIPQVGRVVIHNNVEIGANVTIDRGALGDTIIHEGVKIDNLVQIAHNCEIGAHTAIAAMVGMAGSTKIGKGCRIAGAAKFVGHLEVADNCIIAGATIVSRSIEESGHYAGSYPFQSYRDWQQNAARIKRLKTLFDKIKQFEKDFEKNEE